MPGLLERLDDDGVVLGAEGYLFELERRGYLKSGPYVPEVVLDRPDAVAELHREFLAAGADVMVAFTYYGHEEKLRMIGREGDVEALNRQALRLARETATTGGAMLAGNICNTWAYDPADPVASGERVRRMYRDQVRWAADEGADFILSETNDYVGEALIGLEVIREHGLPSVVTFASSEDKTIDGFGFEEACKRLEDAGADVVGLNCSRGPATMLPLLERVRAAVSCPIAGQPVPYRTTPSQATFQALRDNDGRRVFPIALDPFTCTRFDMADFAVAARDVGVRFIGICCGGAPHHVRAMAEALGRTVPASRYSPDLSLHPVLGEAGEDTAGRYTSWRDDPVS
ncbi:MAG TPA: homocysteine S-methyltransferase family protein [Actinomycetes bacterium]